jgi:hypothetical protein
MVPMLGGRFQLTDLLASGDLGMVWQALDQGTGRTVAVKVVHPHLAADPRLADRFLRARRELTALWHPGIARLLEVVVDADALALVSDLVPGTDLGRWPARYGPISAGMAREMAESIADALAAAHRAGMVHGDIKPSNVVAPPPGEESARLTDFSIAVLVRAGRRTPVSNTAHWYRAPEVTDGVVPAPASDVYAFGAVLAEILTGGPWLEERDSGLLHRLRDLGLACMRPEPNLRPTAVQAYQALREMASASAGTSSSARTPELAPSAESAGTTDPPTTWPPTTWPATPVRVESGYNGHPIPNWATFDNSDGAHAAPSSSGPNGNGHAANGGGHAGNGGGHAGNGGGPNGGDQRALDGSSAIATGADPHEPVVRHAISAGDVGDPLRPPAERTGRRPFVRRPAGMVTVAAGVLALIAMFPIVQAIRHSTGASSTAPSAGGPADRVSSAPARRAPSSAGAAAAPRLPSSATERSLQGGAEFVRYWYSVFTSAEATGDVTELARVTSADCVSCNEAVAAIRSGYADGGSMRGGAYLVRKVTNNSLWTLDRPVFDATVDRSPRAIVDRGGAVRDRLEPLTFTNCVAVLEWSNDRWRMLDVPTTGCLT